MPTVGHAHKNPILDTQEIEVEFSDGSRDVYTANFIAEKMYSQLDGEGNHFALLSNLIYHKSDGKAVATDNGCFID